MGKKLFCTVAMFVLAATICQAEASRGGKAKKRVGAEAILDVQFSDCGKTLLETTRSSIESHASTLDFDRIAKTMHGVWVGEETLGDGTEVEADYALIFDMENRVGIALHHVVPGSNAFAELAIRANPVAEMPVWDFLLCDGWGPPPSIHHLYRASQSPAAGLKVLRKLAGLPAVEQPEAATTWSDLLASGFLTKKRDTIVLGGMFTDIAISRSPTSLRIDWMAEYLGSPGGSKDIHDEVPLQRSAGGGFQVVEIDEQTFLLGTGSETWRYLDTTLNAKPDLQFTKTVFGPIAKN